jgi:NDP-sugar pyrophosphorylase family protein
VIDGSQELTHIYVFSPECSRYLRKAHQIHSIDSELLANLSSLPHDTNDILKFDASIFWAGGPADVLQIVDYASLFTANMQYAKLGIPELGAKEDGPLEKGLFANEEHQVPESFQYRQGCIYGAPLSVEEGANVHKSVIGNHCRLGKGCVVSDCVLCEHVTVEDGVELRTCWIGPDSVIKAGSVLRRCIVGPGYSVQVTKC